MRSIISNPYRYTGIITIGTTTIGTIITGITITGTITTGTVIIDEVAQAYLSGIVFIASQQKGRGISRPFCFHGFLLCGSLNKKPRFPAGFYVSTGKSDRAATSVAPDKSDRAGAAGNDHHRPFDHNGAGYHDHLATVRTAFAVRVTMETGAATAFGACAADACNRACNE
jgi:hypothetical protein